MTIRERRRETTKKAILVAALDLIAKSGLHQFSLRQLAAQVGYSPAGLYDYFESKESIVRALAAEGDEILNSHLSQVPADLRPDLRIVELGLAYIGFARLHSEHFQLMFGELSSTRTSLRDPVGEGKPYHFLVKAVAEAVEQGLFITSHHYEVEEIAYGLWCLAHGAAALQLTKLRGFEDEFPTLDRSALVTYLRGITANHA
jgi:AcrR family transcriptional regulator